MIPILLSSAGLAIFAWLWWQRRDRLLAIWAAVWVALLARALTLALVRAGFDSTLYHAWNRAAGLWAIAALALLWLGARPAPRESAWSRWEPVFWGLPLIAALLTADPRLEGGVATGIALAALLLATAIRLVLARPPQTLLAVVVVVWTLGLLPGFPGANPLPGLIPGLFGLAMLAWLLPRWQSSQATGGDQLQLFQQSIRRSREFEILTQIGTALSSSLDVDALLASIHTQLQKLMDVRNFYVAFEDAAADEIRFAFEVEDGQRIPPRRRRRINALTEHIIATGQPLLIAGDANSYGRAHGLAPSGRDATNYLGVPIILQGKPHGVIAVQSHEREDAYDSEHLRMLEIVAGQAAVALDNARLFGEVQRDAGQKAFLNHIARLAISTLSPAEMLSTVAAEIALAFKYDHILLALPRPNVPDELEIQASAGVHAEVSRPSRFIPFGLGLAGQAALNGRMQSAESLDENSRSCPHARCGLALPIRYAGETLGVLQLESHHPAGFPADQLLVLQTLTDQIAVALNHATLFQQLQHQAITDSLTGLKTRRFFMEALQAEWRRARTAGDSFCVVLVDLDEFKPLNDRYGHLEGDRVLIRVARVLEQKCRSSSVIARYGGDEYTILVPACDAESARQLLPRLQQALAADPLLAERGLHGSFGLAVYPDAGATPEVLLHHADADMYLAKQLAQRQAPTRHRVRVADSA